MTIKRITDGVKEKIIEGVDSIGSPAWGFVNRTLNRNIILGFIMLLISTIVYQNKEANAKEVACTAEIRRLNEIIQNDLRHIKTDIARDSSKLENTK